MPSLLTHLLAHIAKYPSSTHESPFTLKTKPQITLHEYLHRLQIAPILIYILLQRVPENLRTKENVHKLVLAASLGIAKMQRQATKKKENAIEQNARKEKPAETEAKHSTDQAVVLSSSQEIRFTEISMEEVTFVDDALIEQQSDRSPTVRTVAYANTVSNKSWAELGGISLRELNRLEVKFAVAINWHYAILYHHLRPALDELLAPEGMDDHQTIYEAILGDPDDQKHGTAIWDYS